MAYITTKDNVRLYYKEWGSGRPVVLLHGWPLSADTFDALGLVLADAGMRVIAYDRRGFGRSEQPWDGYDYDTLTDDLAEVLDQTEASDAALVGFSMGGGEVARYMSRYNGRDVSQVVFISAVVPYLRRDGSNPDGVNPEVFAKMAAGIREDRPAFWSSFFKDFYGSGMFHPVSGETIDWSRQMAMQASLKATLACAESFAGTDFRLDLDAITVPALIIHGTADKTVPIDVSARKAAARMPSAKYIEYDGGPHGLFVSHKDQLAADVLAFLTSERQGRPAVVAARTGSTTR